MQWVKNNGSTFIMWTFESSRKYVKNDFNILLSLNFSMENLWIQIDSQNGYTKQVWSFFWLINTFVANLQLWKIIPISNPRIILKKNLLSYLQHVTFLNRKIQLSYKNLETSLGIFTIVYKFSKFIYFLFLHETIF